MGVPNDELMAAVKLGMQEVPTHTGRIVYVPKVRSNPEHFGGASCVYVEEAGKVFAVSCQHVTNDAEHVYILGIPPLSQPTPVGAKPTERVPSAVLRADASLDVAVLDAADIDFAAAKKKPYKLSDSDFITEERTKGHVGTLSFMCGAWGEKSEMMSLGPTRKYIETPLYFGAGPIASVRADAIVANFAERTEFLRDVATFPQLQDVKISGGSRDLSGTSGSGLWVTSKGKVFLAGILTGPASGVAGDPAIRFTPIWRIRELIRAI